MLSTSRLLKGFLLKTPAAMVARTGPIVPHLAVRSQPISSWTPRKKWFSSIEVPAAVRKATDLLFFHSQAVMGLAVGGLVATTGAIIYYKVERDMVERFLSKTDRIKLERAEQEGGFSIPLPFLTFAGWACLGILTAVVSRTKANLDLNFRQFASRVNFSLNSVVEGQLTFRTIQEKSLDQLMLGNSAAISVVKQSITKVTATDPFLRFPPAYNFFIMNSILNDLSSMSAMSFFQNDRAMEVERVRYILGLTFERTAPFKKLRVMLASEEFLKKLAGDPDMRVELEHPLHSERWATLLLMSQIYQKTGANNPNSCLWKVEIAIPKIPRGPTQS